MNISPLRKKTQKVLGGVALFLGCVGIAVLVVFYSAILFSDQFPFLNTIYGMFRLFFSIPSGIVVIWALFFSIFFPLFFLVFLGLWLMTHKRYITNAQIVIMVVVWIIALSAGSLATVHQVGQMLERIMPFSKDPITFKVSDEIPYTVRYVFRTTLRSEVARQLGAPKEGYEPNMFLQVFPGLTESDFEGVQASIGSYTMANGRLIHQTDNTKLIHTAAKAITDRGMDTLLANVSVRLGVDLSRDGTLTQIMTALVREDATSSAR